MRFRKAKCLVERLHLLLLDRCLHMQIVIPVRIDLIPQTVSIHPSDVRFRSPRTAEAVILLICLVMIRFTRRLQILGSRYFRTTRMARG